MKLFRTVLFWCHLATGLTVGALVLVMSVTGALLTYERQITDWADTRGLDGSPPEPTSQRLGAADLLRRIAEHDRREGFEPPSSVAWRSDADAPVAVSYGRERTRFVSAYTGEALGDGDAGVRAFFDGVTGWHRWLGAGDDGRDVGRAVTGASNLGFLFLVVSGLYLWWPRNWTRRALRNVTLFRRGLSPKARDFNWHNVIGFWSLVPLAVVVASGVVISYPWASRLVYEIVGEVPPERGRGRSGGGRDAPDEPEPASPAQAFSGDAALGAVFARAAERVPDWRRLSLEVPAPADSAVTVGLDRGTGGQPQLRAQLMLDRRTGAEVSWEPFEATTPGRRLRSILRFAHTGEVLGVAGQTLAGAVSLGAAVLVWTGLALSWRRLWAWRRRRLRVAPRR